jgi:Ni/Fe-hydrogenase subunit HybB-like protein
VSLANQAAPLARQFAAIEETVRKTQGRPGAGWALLLLLAITCVCIGGYSEARIIREGMQLTGLNRPVGWGWFITDFVFWVGIAHSGTLISAILYLFRARFRTAVYRAAEAMTVIGVMTAGLFPVIHLGRPWHAYWILPYPNQRQLWINFRSPLVWDAFAISTYFTVSLMFLLSGLMPDAAALRDASRGWRRRFYGFFAMGWRNSSAEWRHHGRAYLFFAAFATPLVISVHSVVSWDFAVSIVPGWHSTLFPPYFVAGAILSGVAMVITLLIPIRRAFKLEGLVTLHHLDMLSRLVMLTSGIVTYSYATEFLLALRTGHGAEYETLMYRATGAFWPFFWTMVVCNCVLPLFLYLSKVRRSLPALMVISILINVGMWLERFNIIVSSLEHNRIPFDWTAYHPRLAEMGITVGSFGWFSMWLLLFLKLLPAVSTSELKEEAAHAAHEARAGAEVAHAS